MPLARRLPKRGFSNARFKKTYSIVNVGELNVFDADTVITPELMLEYGFIRKLRDGLKILGNGEVEKAFIVKAHKISKSAEEKILAGGGKVEVI